MRRYTGDNLAQCLQDLDAQSGGGGTIGIGTPSPPVSLGSIPERLSELAYNVKAYGAEGNGSTNDADAINAAISAAAATGGGTVYLPPSSSYYLVNSAITMASSVRLVGTGEASQIRHTISDGGDVIVCSGITDFEITGLRIYGSGTTATDTTYAIRVTNSSTRGWIHHNTIEQAYLGIGVLDTPTGGSSNVSICDNVFHDIGLNAVGFNSFGTSTNRCDRNLIYTFGIRATSSVVAAAIEIRGVLLTSCSGNEIRDGNYGGGPYVDGIRLENATEGATAQTDYSSVNGNVISTVSGHGIRMAIARKAIISNNVIYDAGKGGNGYGILLYSDSGHSWSTEDCVVSGNWIEGTHANHQSIRLESDNSSQPTRRNVIIGNRCAGGGEGIECITGTADNLITGNYVYNTTGIGIRHDAGVRNVISNNKVLNCGTSGTPGIGIVGGTDIRVIENESYDTAGSPAMTYGLRIYAGPTNTVVIGGKYQPSLTGGILDAGTTSTIGPLIGPGSMQTIASATTVTLTEYGSAFFISGTTTITSVTASFPMRQVTLIFQGALTFTDGSNLKLAGNFVTTADDTITLVCDGTNWYEVCRSVN